MIQEYVAQKPGNLSHKPGSCAGDSNVTDTENSSLLFVESGTSSPSFLDMECLSRSEHGEDDVDIDLLREALDEQNLTARAPQLKNDPLDDESLSTVCTSENENFSKNNLPENQVSDSKDVYNEDNLNKSDEKLDLHKTLVSRQGSGSKDQDQKHPRKETSADRQNLHIKLNTTSTCNIKENITEASNKYGSNCASRNESAMSRFIPVWQITVEQWVATVLQEAPLLKLFETSPSIATSVQSLRENRLQRQTSLSSQPPTSWKDIFT